MIFKRCTLISFQNLTLQSAVELIMAMMMVVIDIDVHTTLFSAIVIFSSKKYDK